MGSAGCFRSDCGRRAGQADRELLCHGSGDGVSQAWLPTSLLAPVLCALVMAGMAVPSGAADPNPALGERIAVLTDGRRFGGELEGRGVGGEWRFVRDGKTVKVEQEKLVCWGAARESVYDSWILLRDGSLLVADLLQMQDGNLTVAGRLWPETRLPREAVSAILFRPPLDTLQRDQLLTRIGSRELAGDRLLLDNGDELRGEAPQRLVPEPGAFHPENIAWSLPGSPESVEIPMTRVTALLFRSSEAAGEAEGNKGHWIGLRDGSRLRARKLQAEGLLLRLNLQNGVSLETEPGRVMSDQPWELVTWLQPIGGNSLVYLSELPSLGYKHIPFLQASWPFLKDRSVSGGLLRYRDSVALKGIGMHSSSRLAYEVPAGYDGLQAELGLDARAGRQGSVVFRVYLQGRSSGWAKAFESRVVRGGDPPVPLDLDLNGAARVALIVDFADQADQWDHANWLNARFVR